MFAQLRWVVFAVFAAWIALSLVSWSAEDAGWFQQGSAQVPHNWLGRFGAWTADALLFGFGFSAAWLSVLSAALAFFSWRFARALQEGTRIGLGAPIATTSPTGLLAARRWIGFALLLTGSTTLGRC